MNFKGGVGITKALEVNGKLGFSGHPMIDHFSLPEGERQRRLDPEDDHPGAEHAALSRRPQDDLGGGLSRHGRFYSDLGKAYNKAVHAFYDAGCRYLQLDDISFAYLCDPEQREMLRKRGDDPEHQPEIYAGLVREALRDKPDDLAVTMHLCRGNFRSTFIASGGYEPIADILFNSMPIDGYFMEWDSDRAGGFEPLRYLPGGQAGRARPRHHEDRRSRGSRRHCRSASRRRRNLRRSNSSACRRSAASPPPRKATRLPRKSSGRSFP